MPEHLILAMAALGFWTFLVLALVPLRRRSAILDGKAHIKDFRYGQSETVPGEYSIPNRNYMNLLELPVLFYVVCLIVLATRRYDEIMVMLAWAFVVARIIHSLIHLTYNNVMHRFFALGAGLMILIAMWAREVWMVLAA